MDPDVTRYGRELVTTPRHNLVHAPSHCTDRTIGAFIPGELHLGSGHAKCVRAPTDELLPDTVLWSI